MQAILCCQNEDDFLNESNLNKKKYLQQKENPFWENADQEAYPLYLKWIKEKSRNSQVNPENYPFRPFKNEHLSLYLKRLEQFIHNTKSIYPKRLAKNLFNKLEKILFKDVDSSKKNYVFMAKWNMHKERTRTCKPYKPLKLKSSRYPIDEVLCKKFILLAMKKCIETLSHFDIEILLYIWIAQSGAREKRRSFTVNDILKIRLSDLEFDLIIKQWRIVIDKKSFPISHTLIRLIKAYADKRKPMGTIFSINRSSFENYLRKLTKDLGFDYKTFPVTPETFLEEAHFATGHRYIP